MHAIDKHEKKKIIIVKTFNKKSLEKWIDCFLFFNHSLKWFVVVPPKDGFALFETKLGESRKKGIKQCVDSLFKLFFENLKNHHGNIT
jgi:hypothetical protein